MLDENIALAVIGGASIFYGAFGLFTGRPDAVHALLSAYGFAVIIWANHRLNRARR